MKKTFLFNGIKRMRELGMKIDVRDGNLYITPSNLVSQSVRDWATQHKDAVIAYCYEDEKVSRWCDANNCSDQEKQFVLGNYDLRLCALEKSECL